MKIFETLLKEMDRTGSDSTEPRAFSSYLDDIGFVRSKDSARTAACISIDFQENLRSELRDHRVMVFRLGIPKNQRNTFFALSRTKQSWGDYFIFDDNSDEVREYIPPAKLKPSLAIFRLLPKLTEKSLVSFVFGSGLMQELLDLDERENLLISAGCQSTFSFRFGPNPLINTIWTHNRGQVEIDGLFLAKKGGKKQLILVESKHGISQKSIAKHKLVYPVLSMAQKIDLQDLSIVPVYLKTEITGQDLSLCVTLCEYPSGSKWVTDLQVKSQSRLIIKNFLS